MELETTIINGQELIVTEGGNVSGSGKIAGLFWSADDAASPEADALAVGTVRWDVLTPEQQAIAGRNSELLCL
jgi:hypothetical protein